MRLIDADKLNFKGQKYNKSQMKAIPDFIDAQPTIYDIDKVAEELFDDDFVRYDDDFVIPIDRAIEIVKQGLKEQK